MTSVARDDRHVEHSSTTQDALVMGGSRRARGDRSISMPPDRSALNPHDRQRHINPSSGPADGHACSGVPHVGQSASKTESTDDGVVSIWCLLPKTLDYQSSRGRVRGRVR